MKRYAIMSDFHKLAPKEIDKTIKYLKDNDVDELIMNGDLIGDHYFGLTHYDYFGLLLSSVVRSGLVTYVLPGGHETVNEFESIIRLYQLYSPNIHYVVDEPFINQKDHHLVFLPGSDWRVGKAKIRGFRLENTNTATGIYRLKNEEMIDNHKKDVLSYYSAGNLSNLLSTRLTRMGDLEELVRDPEITVLISHIPMHFSNLEISVDMAEFGEVTEDFDFGDRRFRKGSIIPKTLALTLKDKNYSVVVKKENRGNKDLAEIITKIGLKKHITGHFHESVHRAHTLSEKPLEQGDWTDELFFNASHADVYKFGIVDVNEDKIRFYRVNLQ